MILTMVCRKETAWLHAVYRLVEPTNPSVFLMYSFQSVVWTLEKNYTCSHSLSEQNLINPIVFICCHGVVGHGYAV